MCLAAPQNFAGFAAVRCLLGFAEGAVSPAFITITSIWYKKEEHPLRVGMWVGFDFSFSFFFFFHYDNQDMRKGKICSSSPTELSDLYLLC